MSLYLHGVIGLTLKSTDFIMNQFIKNAILLLSFLLPTTLAAQDLEIDNIYYHIAGDHAIVTSGTYPYYGDVTIPDSICHNDHVYPVTDIDRAAFRECSALTSISIPRTVTQIGEHAFAGCTALDSVDISDLDRWCGINFESESANPCYHAHRLFLKGTEITELVISDSVSTISSFAFSSCASISSVTIPSTVTEIGAASFTDCSSLTAISVDHANPVYDSRDSCNAIIKTASGTLIAGCQKSVIPSGVKKIGDWAFYCCTGLTSIYIPNSVTEFGFEAFYRCESLIGVNIPNSVRVIGYQAFYGCSSLRGIHIPGSVRGIGDSAFEYCPSLSSMSVAIDNPRYDSRDDCNAIIETRENTLIAGCRNTVIPSSVSAIGDYAFSGCSTLAGIDIPVGVDSVGDYAFRGCTALRSVTLPMGINSIGASAFFDCKALNRVDIPASVRSIGAFAFEHCPAIYGMSVDSDNPVYDSRDSCNAIIETATGRLVAGCMNTVIPSTVNVIGDNAFSGCFMLTKVSIPKSVRAIGNYAFTGCTSLSSITIPNSVTYIGDAAFSDCSALRALEIPNTVTALGQAAFGGCSSLESISLPKSVTAIGDYEFYGCSLLKDITIPNTVQSIGTAAFRGCVSLTGINIPKSVTAIGSSAFRECPSLQSVTVANGNPYYDSRQGCNAIIETATGTLIAGCQNTVIPASVTAIGYAAFDGCVFLNSISIPNAVTRIGRKAFNNCVGLKDVVCGIVDPSLVATAPDAFMLPSREYGDRILHVPATSISSYQSRSPWNEQFGHIEEFVTTAKN